MILRRWFRKATPAKRRETAGSFQAMGDLLTGRTALITGAGRNIGRAIALELAQQGADIHFTETDAGRRTALQTELRERYGQGQGYAENVGKLAEVDALCARLTASDVSVDIVVNNVAYQVEEPLAATTTEQWVQSMQTNIIGPVALTRRLVKEMISAEKGDILFITSLHQQLPSGWPAYSASKSALAMIVKELAVELAPHAIRVNAIAPGWVTEERKASKLALLHGESIDPAYIGRAAVFLLSDYFSHYTTGTTLTVDAGMSLYSGRIPFALPDRAWWDDTK